MKKGCFTVLLTASLAAVLTLEGCGQRTADDDRAYLNEDGGAGDDVVNTFQAGSKYKIVTPMMELKEAVEDIIGENYWPDTLLTEEEFAERTGISEELYESFMAEYQRSEAGIDMLILIKAKDNSVEEIEKYLNEYRNVLLKIYEDQLQNEAKVYASRIETIQDYVCYVQLGADITKLKSLGRNEMVAYCQQENERAIDIIEKRIQSWDTE